MKHAFFSVPIYNDRQKYLKFIFGNLFQFTSMPNGYGPAMRIFTQISNVSFRHLRSQLSCICRRFMSPRRCVSTFSSQHFKIIERTGFCSTQVNQF